MKTAAKRRNEAATLRALLDLEVLDSEPEPEFDALAHAAAAVCGVPMALVSLVDHDRQWFKANVGLEGTSQTGREASFCAHAVLSDSLFVVEDATKDSRFAHSSLVLGEPHIRFYAGSPLCLSNGMRVGTLCVMDRLPRALSHTERFALERLAVAVVRALEGRLAVRQLLGKSRTMRTMSAPSGVQGLVDAALRNVDAAMGFLFATEVWEKPKQDAMHYCLTSTAALLGITHKLLDPEEPFTPQQREAAWKQLAEDTKVAGRSAYRAALALVDPCADRETVRGA